MTSNSAFSFKKKMVSLDDDDENVQINIKKNSQDRKIDMDVISNKNVNIGLDLLVNPDKQRKGDTSQPSTPKNDDVSKPVIDFDKDDDDLDFNNLLSKSNKSQENIEQLMSRMNLDDDIPTSSSNDKKETFLDDIKPSTDRDNDVDSHRSLSDDDRNDRRSRSEYNDYDSRPSRSYEDERREKEEVLYQLEKMRLKVFMKTLMIMMKFLKNYMKSMVLKDTSHQNYVYYIWLLVQVLCIIYQTQCLNQHLLVLKIY